jgi:hypothetical protein
MPYIGRDTDKISNVEVLDNITFDGSSSYTLQKGGSNFTPSSANTLLLSIDGVVQAGNFTVSGSTIDFGTAVAGTSTCDFVLHYGVGLITTPSDGTVTTAKLADSSITTAKLNDASVSLAKLTATGTKDATTFLRGDNTFAEAGGGIEMADQWRFSTNFTSSSEKINTGWERNDNSYYGGIGTGMTESSGNFTFPSTGIYYISFVSSFNASAFRSYAGLKLRASSDGGSNYSDLIDVYDSISGSGEYGNVDGNYLLDVTNVSNIKVALYTSASGAVTYEGHSTFNRSYMTFIRLGDT